MVHKVALDDKLPLARQLTDYDATKFIRVFLYDENLVQIGASPVDLDNIGNGMYSSDSVQMPNTRWVIAQYVTYEDAGYTILSPSVGGDSDTFILNGLEDTDVLPLAVQLFNYDSAQFPRAFVTDSNDNAIVGSPFNLTAVGTLGLYINNAVPTPDSLYVNVQYIFYEDGTYAVISPELGGSKDSFFFVGEAPFNLSGNLPWVGDALCGYFQPMSFTFMLKKTVNFQLVEVREIVRTRGVLQPFAPQEVKQMPRGQREWRWFRLHAEPTLNLDPDDVVTYLARKFRVMSKLDYGLYGYNQYNLIEDYT